MDMNKKLTDALLKNTEMGKNNIGLDLKMEVTPEFQKILDDPEYKEIIPQQLKTRKITDEELSKIPFYAKSIFGQISYGFVFIFLMFAVISIAAAIYNIDALETKEFITFIVIGIVFAAVPIWNIRMAAQSTIKSGSEVAEGTVTFFSIGLLGQRDGTSTDRRKHYVGVAFPDQKAYVKRVTCSTREYYKLKLNSKVFVVKVGNGLKAHIAE